MRYEPHVDTENPYRNPRKREPVLHQDPASMPEPFGGLYNMAAYASGLIIEAGTRVLPAQSAVRCTDEPSIRQCHNVYTVDPAENDAWLQNTKPSRDKVLQRRYRDRGMVYPES